MNKLIVVVVLCLLLCVAFGENNLKKRTKSVKHRTAKQLAKHRARAHHREDPPADGAAPAPEGEAPAADGAAGGAFQTCEPPNIASIHAVQQTPDSNRCWAATGAAVMSATTETAVSEQDVVDRVTQAGVTLGEADLLPLNGVTKYLEVVGAEEVAESFTLQAFCDMLKRGPLILTFQTTDRMGHIVMVLRAQGSSDADMQVSYIDPDDIQEKLVPITRLRELYTEETYGHLYQMKEAAGPPPTDPPA